MSKREQVIEVFFLAAALMWAAVGRLGYAGVHPFAFDEARLSLLALQLARVGQFPQLGMVSSAGLPNLPGAVWLFALPYALSTDPLIASLFMGIIGTVTVFLGWGLARALWGPRAALATAWLMAGSPYLAFYARSVWAQDWLPFLALVWTWVTWRAMKGSRSRHWALQGFLAGFMPLVHYAGVALIPPALIAPLGTSRRRGRALKFTLLGLALATLLALPSLLALLPHLRSLLSHPEMLTSKVSVDHGRGKTAFTQAALLLNLFTGKEWHLLLVGPEEVLAWGTVQSAVEGLLVVFLLGGVAVAACKARPASLAWQHAGPTRNHRSVRLLILRACHPTAKRPFTVLLGLWALSTVVLWTLVPVPARIHYHLPSLPALFVLAGAAVVLAPPRGQWALVVLAVAIALVQGVHFGRGLTLANAHLTPRGISTPLGYARAARAFVADGSPVIAVVPGDDPTVDGDAAMFEVLLWDIPHRLVDGRHIFLLPRRDGWLLFSSLWLPALDEMQRLLPPNAYEVYEIPKREGEWPFVAVKVKGGVFPFIRAVPPVDLENGVRFLGFRWATEEARARLITAWYIGQGPAKERTHIFNHIYVPGQQEPVQVRDIPASSRAWRAGDILIAWVDFDPLPSGAGGRAGVGMYTYPSLQRVPHLNSPNPLAPIWLPLP